MHDGIKAQHFRVHIKRTNGTTRYNHTAEALKYGRNSQAGIQTREVENGIRNGGLFRFERFKNQQEALIVCGYQCSEECHGLKSCVFIDTSELQCLDKHSKTFGTETQWFSLDESDFFEVLQEARWCLSNDMQHTHPCFQVFDKSAQECDKMLSTTDASRNRLLQQVVG